MRMQSNRYTDQAELADHVMFKTTIDIMIHNNKYGGIEANVVACQLRFAALLGFPTSFTARTEGNHRLSGVL